jgi:hypothetical protein
MTALVARFAFALGSSSIAKHWLMEVGLFDLGFDLGNPQLAKQFARIFLNQYSIQEVHRAYQSSLKASN